MTGPAGVVDFFALEAGEYLDRLDSLLAEGARADRAPEAEPFARNARALRGCATMARQSELAELAAALEAVASGVRDGTLAWSPAVGDAATAAVDEFRALVRAVRGWGGAESARANARTQELRAALPGAPRPAAAPSRIVPVRTLFHDDAGPHVVRRAPSPPITADLRFRQAVVPLASALRRLIGEARHADPEAEGTRRSLGEDLRAALRDLRELAESYDIAPVVNFAAAREEPLGRLDARALEMVDGAAAALIESAGVAWARSTPPASAPAVDLPLPAAAEATPAPPPTPPPAVAVPSATPASGLTPISPFTPVAPLSTVLPPLAPGAPRETPPSGRALAELLQSSLSGFDALADEPLGDVVPAAAPRTAAATDEGGVVPVETLVYRGRAALARARDLRDRLRRQPVPDRALLDELYDLLDLATTD